MATIRVVTKGPPFDALMKSTVKDLRAANRVAGREIAKAGSKAIRDKAPRMWGKKLGVKTKTNAWPDRAEVTFTAKPAGGWAMAETGTKPHQIRPRRRTGRGGRPAALRFSGLYAADVRHPGTSGDRAWTKAVARLKAAITPVVADVYDDALGA